MTVEIREMIVRAVIREPRPGEASGTGENREDLVAECVEKVIEVLKEEQER